MKVAKRSVEQFDIADGTLILTREEAGELYDTLGSMLGRPKLDQLGCSERYSHGAHVWGKSSDHFCSGRSFDAT